ncbi:antagonist of KipI [Mucilaginibacter yixingensis]|uniref:Antagonist of KipI n=1 Tax=Mucilaginibacter yixingensis TaxID=1295612 RepID=A0A2T5JGT0_9SPHI|nr:biotin-dependent carboxyltransferase family protein [Mucilaginibacter yixingensis]PTR01619.1 antagonist of KipI [Mucilaginibacter yixingensis]
MQIEIIKPGMLSTVQDLGRTQSRGNAVPVSGAMDTLSARVANLALGNEQTAAVIEFTYADAIFKAQTDLLIAWSGDGAILQSDGQMLPADRPLLIPQGKTIKLINNPTGCRTYLAVAGGWNVPEVLGSKSTYITAGFGGLEGRAFRKGDVLQTFGNQSETNVKFCDTLTGAKINYPRWSIARPLFLPADRKLIRVMPGPEADWFDADAIASFYSAPYRVGSRSNRMGIGLEGEKVKRKIQTELLSTAVTPGTIQVTNNNDMILLMADCQTTGGYPRIAQVAAVDLPLCAQLKPGDEIRFQQITRQEAERLLVQRERELRRLNQDLLDF